MLELKLRANAFCETVIQKRIDDDGFVYTVPFLNTILFYAGPSEHVLDMIQEREGSVSDDKYPANWSIAAEEATRLKANRIDDTKIFVFLISDELKALLIERGFLSEIEVNLVSKYIWDYVSYKFSRTSFKKAAMLVCGASKESSFYVAEMLGILDNPCVEVINEKPADLFRAFRELGKDEINRLMAMTCLLEMRKHAGASNDNEAWDNYKRQRKYFILYRQEEKRAFAKQPKDVKKDFRQTRKEILTCFKKDKKNNAIYPKGQSSIPAPSLSF